MEFDCVDGPSGSEAVREVFSLAQVREGMLAKGGGAWVVPVDGYYGIGQWMTTYDLPSGKNNGVSVGEALGNLEIPYDPAQAAALLKADGWTLNEQGTPFVAGADTNRPKEENGLITPLVPTPAIAP